MRALPGGACDPARAAIERDAASHEVDRHLLPGMRDGVLLAFDRDRLLGLQASVRELVEEDEQPAFAGDRGRGVVLGERLLGIAKLVHAPTRRFHERTIASLRGTSVTW